MCLAIPGLIEEILCDDELTRSARVNFGGVSKTVNVAFVPEALPGDYVVVHVGVAITRLDAAQAQRILQELEAMAKR